MKLTYLSSIAICLLLSGIASAQPPVRRAVFHNDAAESRQIDEFFAARKREAAERERVKHLFPNPEVRSNDQAPGRPRYVRNTAMATMTVRDGRPSAPVQQVRVAASSPGLVMGAGTKLLRGVSTGNRQVDSFLVDSSLRYRIDPLLIYAQMHQESSFKPGATSHKGASGLMQLMPATARRMGVTNIYDPQQNIEGGVKYMRLLLDMFDQDLSLALAGYNAGEGAVLKYGRRIPPYAETQDYVKRIAARYRTLRARYQDNSGYLSGL